MREHHRADLELFEAPELELNGAHEENEDKKKPSNPLRLLGF